MAASKGLAPVPRTPDEQREHLAEVLQGKSQLARDKLQEIQDSLLERSLGVVQDAMTFAEVKEDSEAPPPEWIDELGYERAWSRWRMAKAAWRNGRDAPVGLKVAAQVATGILKAKAQEKSGPKTLNVALVNWAGPLPQFPEQDFERD